MLHEDKRALGSLETGGAPLSRTAAHSLSLRCAHLNLPFVEALLSLQT